MASFRSAAPVVPLQLTEDRGMSEPSEATRLVKEAERAVPAARPSATFSVTDKMRLLSGEEP